jgi:hypothetical protein
LAKTQPLIAVRLAIDREVELPDGRTLRAIAGDWLITRNRIVVDVCGPSQLDERYKIIDGNDRMLSAALRTRLEQTLGLGTTNNSDDLIAAVERLAAISIGTVKIEFTPGQLEEIAYRAKKRGQSIEQTLQAVVDRIKEEIFWRS